MAIRKICPRCQNQFIEYTKKLCDKCNKIAEQNNTLRYKQYNEKRTDKEFQAIYKSPAWKRVRSLALARAKGLCEECLAKGKISYVDDVHHKIPIKKDITKAFDINNLICLCRQCHIKAHKKLKG